MSHQPKEPMVFHLAPTPDQAVLFYKLRGCARQSYNEAVRLFHEGKKPEEFDFYAAITDSACDFVLERPYLQEIPLITRQMAIDEACIAQRRLQKDGKYVQGRLEIQAKYIDYETGFYFAVGPADLRPTKTELGIELMYIAVGSTLVLIALTEASHKDLETRINHGNFKKLALIHRDERENWYLLLR